MPDELIIITGSDLNVLTDPLDALTPNYNWLDTSEVVHRVEEKSVQLL